MGHEDRRVNFWALGALVSIVLAFSALVHAQSYTAGQPVIATTSSSIATDGIFWDAKQFAGSDICAQINAAWTAAMASGVTSATIDARGITGPQTCAASPFPGNASGKLLLGNAQITTNVTWQIPNRTHVEGMGLSANAARTANTTLLAGSSAADPLVQLGNNKTSTYDVQIRNMTVNAAGLVTTGILNSSALEGSMVEDVGIYNATLYGLLLTNEPSGHNASGSGPYRNINVQYDPQCSTCGRSTTGILIQTSVNNFGMPVRGLDNITVTGRGTPGESLGSCIAIIGFPTQITNSHVEYCTTGIQIGAAGGPGTANVEIQDVSTDPFNGWNITITNASDILLSGIVGSGNRVLQDNVTGNKIMGKPHTTSPVGFYLLGDGPNPAVITTAASQSSGTIAWVAPGDMHVIGNLEKTSGTFKIDHPLDPANKYLYHSFVESPDMMDVYNGSVITDKHGRAVVTLPDYFESLNRDFRYQLTAIGTFAQATVAKEIQNNQFTIRSSKPGVKVSWQVTGIRQDAYAKSHEIKVEEEKPPSERGHYLHPELFDASGRGSEQAIDK